MKIRADFVTNSSSSSYVDIYADNPAFNKLLEKYNSLDAYMHYTTDWCSEHEKLEYSESLLDFLYMIAGTHDTELQEELEKKKATLLKDFRYAKYNTGFHYTDGYLSGEEHHVTLSSRWGVVDQYTYIDEDNDYEDDDEEEDEDYDEDNEDEYEDYDEDDNEDEDEDEDEDYDGDDENDNDDENDDYAYENPVPNCFRGGDDWEYVITEKKERPTEKTAGFEGVKPEDLKKKTDLSEKMKVVLENLSEEPVEINGRKFVFIGDYDQYTRIASDGESEDANEKEEWDDWDDDDMDPWNDRECSHVIDNNIPETGLISLWLTPLGGKIRSITKTGDVGKADYVVVRLDPWAEDCIDIEKIRKAAASGIKIISEYQLWKAIFDSPSNEMSGKKEDNPDIDDFIIENGILKEYKGKARAIEVPEGVISIERDAFRGNKTMMKISLPEGLKYIGKKAFMGVTLKEIILPESLEELGDEVFTYCETLHSIRIPANVRALGDGVFNDCDLTEIIVDEANQYFTSVDGVLFSKDMNRLIVYPKAREDSKYVVPDTVREIGRVAFWQNRNLTEVVLPAGLESIGSAAFCWCKKLVIMDLPDSIKSIGFNALSNTKLKRVIVPGTMSIIESGVFSWNDSLKEAVISEGVTKISDYAFAGTGINEIAIPQSVTEIEHDAFCNCFSLKKAIVPGHIADPEKHFPNCEITVQG